MEQGKQTTKSSSMGASEKARAGYREFASRANGDVAISRHTRHWPCKFENEDEDSNGYFSRNYFVVSR